MKQKVVFALALCSVIPLFVLAHVLHGNLVPSLGAANPNNVLAIPTLVAFSGLLMAGGRGARDAAPGELEERRPNSRIAGCRKGSKCEA